MKIRVTFEMPLPEGFEPFLLVIAETHGYSASQYPDLTPEQFVLAHVCCPQVSTLFKTIITSALSPYFGIVGKEQVEQVQSVYENTHTVVADIVSD
jgi:hypothetical protein